MQKGINLDKLSNSLRKKAIKTESKEILLTNFTGSTQAKDVSQINCSGFGRIRTLSQRPTPNWINPCVRYRVSAARLGLSDEISKFCQVFQNAVCNYRCWFCYVDYGLLCGDPLHSTYLTIDELLDKFLAENLPTKIIALSGGQPDLIPEWAPWFIDALIRRGLEKQYFIWVDDNLSTYYAWEYLDTNQWELMKTFPYLGRLCGVKSFSKERFADNTNVKPEYFDRQIDVLSRLVKEGLDVYIELVLATSSLDNVYQDISKFMDLLQSKVHHNIPLRINPTEIRPYTPTKNRITDERDLALKNQYTVLNIWLEELHKRFSPSELTTPQHMISLD
jgi:uncharacterized Fe-S cluster-containing radical SAM superfamily protein